MTQISSEILQKMSPTRKQSILSNTSYVLDWIDIELRLHQPDYQPVDQAADLDAASVISDINC